MSALQKSLFGLLYFIFLIVSLAPSPAQAAQRQAKAPANKAFKTFVTTWNTLSKSKRSEIPAFEWQNRIEDATKNTCTISTGSLVLLLQGSQELIQTVSLAQPHEEGAPPSDSFIYAGLYLLALTSENNPKTGEVARRLLAGPSTAAYLEKQIYSLSPMEYAMQYVNGILLLVANKM